MIRFERLSSGRVAIFSSSGDFALVTAAELDALIVGPKQLQDLGPALLAELHAKHFLTGPDQPGMARLLDARRAARRETVNSGASLHILVPTLQCGHSCQYCQVSRALDARGFEMSTAMLDAACDAIFESPNPALTVEFQGGDPLIRFDLVRRAIERIARRNVTERRRVQFVVASTLHQLDHDMCMFFREHSVALSTSIDGPSPLHNRNRPVPGRDSYERTVAGIALAREHINPGCVSALMTTTKASLTMPEAVIDEYVRLGFDEVFVRPMASHGFAKRNDTFLGYPILAYFSFYERCLERVLWWNRQGVPLREAAAAIWLNKLLSPFDSGYVDLQSPTGAGSAVLVYNYDGYVYPSDEARMLAETGDVSLRLGRIGEPIRTFQGSAVMQWLREQSDGEAQEQCASCPYHGACGPDPIENLPAGHGVGHGRPVAEAAHCQRSTWMFKHLLGRIDKAEAETDDDFLDLAYAWAQRQHPGVRSDHKNSTAEPTVKRITQSSAVVASKAGRRMPPHSSHSQFQGILVRTEDVRVRD